MALALVTTAEAAPRNPIRGVSRAIECAAAEPYPVRIGCDVTSAHSDGRFDPPSVEVLFYDSPTGGRFLPLEHRRRWKVGRSVRYCASRPSAHFSATIRDGAVARMRLSVRVSLVSRGLPLFSGRVYRLDETAVTGLLEQPVE